MLTALFVLFCRHKKHKTLEIDMIKGYDRARHTWATKAGLSLPFPAERSAVHRLFNPFQHRPHHDTLSPKCTRLASKTACTAEYPTLSTAAHPATEKREYTPAPSTPPGTRIQQCLDLFRCAQQQQRQQWCVLFWYTHQLGTQNLHHSIYLYDMCLYVGASAGSPTMMCTTTLSVNRKISPFSSIGQHHHIEQ